MLKKWNAESFGNIFNRAKDALSQLQHIEASSSSWSELSSAKQRYEDELTKEEIFFRAKSRQTWVRAGDKNTYSFAATLKDNRNRMQAMKLQMGESDSVTMDNSIGYFSKLFISDSYAPDPEFLEATAICIDAEDKFIKSSICARIETNYCGFDLKTDSAPGIDGFTNIFSRKFGG